MEPEGRDEMLSKFGATLGKSLDDPLVNFAAYQSLRSVYEPQVRGEFEARGLVSAPVYWAEFWTRVFPRAAPRDAGPFIQLLYAVSTSADALFDAHRAYRFAHMGNVFWQTVGPPGTAKSSLNLSIADQDRPFPSGSVAKHVCFDQEKLPEMLGKLEPLDYLLLDEQSRQSGENSRVSQDEVANVVDQFRASQKNMATSSPTARDYDASQLRLEVFGVDFEGKKVVALLWYEAAVLGFIERPFVRAPVWQEYLPLKAAHVERSIAGTFRDSTALMRVVNELAERPEFVAFLTGRGKPKRVDFEMAVRMYYSRALSTRTFDSVVSLAHTVCYNWSVWGGGKFREQFGVEAAQGLARIAKSCYREN